MRYQSLEQIYDSLPNINCQNKCQDCCGPIGLFPAEVELLEQQNLPVPTTKESLKWGPLTCSALSSAGKCRIYQSRPLICRLWGLTRSMACPHGCTPSRWLTDKEAHTLMRAAKRLLKGDPAISLDPAELLRK